MKYKWCVILAALLCVSGLADAEQAGKTPEPLAENVRKETEKFSEEESPAKDALAPEAAGKEKGVANASEKKEKAEPLPPMRGILSAEDFALNARQSIRPGEPLGTLITEWGAPKRHIEGAVHDEYAWDGISVSVLKELPERYLRETIPTADAAGPWATAFYLSGKEAFTAAGISVGDGREKLLRTYGIPSGLLWDGKQNCFYAQYEKEDRLLSFTLKENKVLGIQLSYAENAEPKESRVSADSNTRFKDKDFRIAGYALDDIFKEQPWMVWEKKAVNDAEEIWYYAGFSLRMDAKTKRIGTVSITDPRMLTSRGISIGDHRTTLEAFYGEPEKVEMNELEGAKQVVYIYFARDKKQVMLFYIDAKKETVTHIVVMKNPLSPSVFKPLADRISQVREKNSAGSK